MPGSTPVVGKELGRLDVGRCGQGGGVPERSATALPSVIWQLLGKVVMVNPGRCSLLLRSPQAGMMFTGKLIYLQPITVPSSES